MKKITAGLFISLDGVVEAPDQWHFPYFNDEMGAAVSATFGAADTMLFGRKTYDSFAGAWPEREAAGEEDAAFAKELGDVRKIVVSNQKLDFTWRNSEQLEGDLVEAVTALKNEPGGTIGMSGSVSVVRQLLAAGLLDELHLLVHPIAVRKGMRLFDEGETDPAEADLVRDLRDRRPEPRLRARPSRPATPATRTPRPTCPSRRTDARGYSDATSSEEGAARERSSREGDPGGWMLLGDAGSDPEAPGRSVDESRLQRRRRRERDLPQPRDARGGDRDHVRSRADVVP